MPGIDPSVMMIGLDLIMIVFTLWVLSLHRRLGALGAAIAAGLGLWLVALHVGLSNQALFPPAIPGSAFLAVILVAVTLVGALLLTVRPIRVLLLNLPQQHLLLAQGIRVFFGATFLMQAATGVLPLGFGIVDGFTHIGAGFFGLAAAFLVATDDQARRRAWFANVFGLADILIVASTLALILLPQVGPHHPMMYAVFLPAPLWLWFHLFSIYRLVNDRASPRPLHAPA